MEGIPSAPEVKEGDQETKRGIADRLTEKYPKLRLDLLYDDIIRIN